ncbi:GNAT family N-acetyltransferase [Ornithinibacillus salinisoli]|uniref:GNAT family N-acetyltransferase n=1 Tax=Ornithinibacillus salinisoli TaxID=1848459 RepID=A0ABW4VTS0_9BACI
MELQTQRLRIVPCTEELLSIILTTEEYKIGPHITMYLEALKDDSSLLGWGVWFVLDKEYNTIIGDIGFKGKPNSENIVEIGYGMVPSVRSKGYATEAVKKIIEWAFSFENVNIVVAECRDDNVPSIRVLEKLQMKKIGSENNLLKWQLEK